MPDQQDPYQYSQYPQYPPPQQPYAAASAPRAMAFNTVASQGVPGTAIKALVYVNNQLVAQSQPFTSGADPVQGSRYSTWHGAGSEVRKSKRDAEVHALDWTYDVVANMQGKQNVKNFQVDLVVTSGTCNECKERQQRFVNDIARILPSAKSSRTGQWRIKLQAIYDNNRDYPASAGRPNAQGIPTSSYGYQDGRTERRVSAAALDAGTPYDSSQYFSRSHVPGGSAGYVDPRSLTRDPIPGEPRTDRYSPNQSRTPTPPKPYSPPKGRRGSSPGR
ncbi:hypothetical protein [Actinoplanes sp. NPDC049681]|uniref:hypothetical protein n=1 Tax=Actinoplanes sp. NPDC049681 TaxID=3363905 RepID=UPI0037A8A6B3